MADALQELLFIGEPAFCPFGGKEQGNAIEAFLGAAKSIGRELAALLETKNGFFVFDRALLIRSFDRYSTPLGIVQWNDINVWKNVYNVRTENIIFFAEDVFGGQFGIDGDSICYFDPENADLTPVAENLESWGRWILDDHRVRTGWPLLRQWQELYGIIQEGQRLLPKIPFVLGGKFELENLFKLNDIEGMRWRADIANQLLDCPPGAKVVIKLAPPG